MPKSQSNFMKPRKLFCLLFALCLGTIAQAQTYQLTHYFMNIGNSPKPYKGEITISDSFVTFTAFPNATGSTPQDTVASVTKERIAVNKKGYYIKTIQGSVAKNYTFELSTDKTEKKDGIYYISLLVVPSNGPRITLYFIGKKVA
jgi:hypothetical protein